MEQIAEWLANLGMSEYAERFAENRIDFAVLSDLTDQDLKDIGVVLGDRRKILRAIARLDAAPEAVALEPKPPVTFSAALQGSPVGSRERRDLTPDEIVGDAGGGPPRANYYRLVARAVNGLESTAEARQVIYERARKALIAHLRFNQPALSKAAIVKERLALEDAIREIEAGAACKSRKEIPAEPQPAIPAAGTPYRGAASESPQRDGASPATTNMPEGGWPAVLLDAREQRLSGRSSLEKQSVKGFRDIVREVHDFGTVTPKALQAAPPIPEAYQEEAIEPIGDRNDLYWFEFAQERNGQEAYGLGDERLTTLPQVHATRDTAAERTRRSLSYDGLATLLVALIMVVGSAGAVVWKWSAITEFYGFLNHSGGKLESQASHTTASTQYKLTGRVPQQQGSADAPGTTVPGDQTAATQRVVLYEEYPSDPQGKRYTGSAVWRTETVSPGPGFAAELAVRADMKIPERSMAVTWALRRSADKGAYTIEATFNLPADFPGGAIANVPGILMKQSEQAPGTPLAGLAVKVMNGLFVIGLSADDTSAQHNEQLLKERSWFDIPIVYANGGRAILAIEKGPLGDRAFAEAFAAWEGK